MSETDCALPRGVAVQHLGYFKLAALTRAGQVGFVIFERVIDEVATILGNEQISASSSVCVVVRLLLS